MFLLKHVEGEGAPEQEVSLLISSTMLVLLPSFQVDAERDLPGGPGGGAHTDGRRAAHPPTPPPRLLPAHMLDCFQPGKLVLQWKRKCGSDCGNPVA